MVNLLAPPVAPAAARQRTHADLRPDEVAEIGRRLDAIRDEVLASRGARDAAYIRRVITVQRTLVATGRIALLGSRYRPAWWVGTTALALAKILDNMEVGHNVLHGQWDWMRDPKIHSSTWQWDHASPPEQWQRAHNDRHHVNTNVLGKDNDLGYGIMRVDEAQEWEPRHLVQPLVNFVNACIFEWGIAMYDLDLGAQLREGNGFSADTKDELRTTLRQAGRNARRDYVLHPLMSLPTGSFRSTVTANLVANLVRNVWSHSVIMCGHFPEGVETFEVDDLDEHESRGSGTCARCSVRRTSPARPSCTSCAGTCPTRSSTISSPTCRATATARSLGRSGRCSRIMGCATTPRPSSGRWQAPGTRCCGSRFRPGVGAGTTRVVER